MERGDGSDGSDGSDGGHCDGGHCDGGHCDGGHCDGMVITHLLRALCSSINMSIE